MQIGEARHIDKGGRDKIEIIANADDIRIGIVGIERRIGTGAIAPVGLPCKRVTRKKSKRTECGGSHCFEFYDAVFHEWLPLTG